jgi:hypothetical protein
LRAAIEAASARLDRLFSESEMPKDLIARRQHAS